jgi:N utilization substance protein A
LFESLTGAKLKDCIVVEDRVTFVVEKGNMGLAIGRHASNIRRIEGVLKKQIKIIEFDEDVRQFIRNYAYPLNMFEVTQNEKKVVIKGRDTKTKAMLIGRDRTNLKKMNEDVKRYFDIEEITVV